LFNAYGLTEASFAVFLGDLDERTGRATPSIGSPVTAQARIRRDDGFHSGGAAEGELELAGPAVSAGYYDNPDATRSAFCDGWLRTGDLVRRDGSGRYYVTGRCKDVVLKGAFSIHLNEVEDAAAGLPHVIEAVAVPLRLPTGEDIGVILRTADGALDVEAARAELTRRLGPQRAPRRVVATATPLPRVGQGKIARPQALAMWRELVSSRPASS
jgi:acyl-CoA synthetase (AMP-forming)/AMP-acid ligase II